MAKLDYREMGAIRWLLGQLLMLISLSGAYALELGAGKLITVSLALIVVGCLLPNVLERIPKWFWKVSPAFLLVWIVSDFFLAGGDILTPLFRMVLVLGLYRSLQIRTPREDLQLLLLALFLLLLSGVLSQEVTFGLQMLLFAPIAMGLLFVVNLAHREPGVESPGTEAPIFIGHGWRRVLKRARQRLDPRTLTAGLILFIMTTGMAMLFFILLPRFDIGAALPFPRLQTKQSLTGFSDHVQYGDVVSILNDDAIAMRVDVNAENPPARPYWRMVALDAYYDGGFRVSPSVAKDYRTLQNYRFDFEEAGFLNEGNDSEWTLYLEGGVSSYLPMGDTFQSLLFKNRTTLQFHDLTRVVQNTGTNANTLSIRYEGMEFGGVIPYGVEDPKLLGLSPVFVDSASPDYLKTVRYPQTLLVVPGGQENFRILDAVLDSMRFRRGISVDDFSERLIAYLQSGRGYSLESRIPEGEADTLLRWLDSDTAGHCELYAGAFVLISRYAGFPSRLVTGFAGGDWNGFENYYMVRNRHAHAWCEIFDPKRGWVRVDPTPGNSSTGVTVASALAGGLIRPDKTWQAYLDSLRIVWFRRVIQFDGGDQLAMADSFKGMGLSGLGWLKQLYEDAKKRFDVDLEAFTRHGRWQGILGDLLIPLLLALGTCLLWLSLHRRIRKRNFEQIMRKRAGRLLHQFQRKGISREGSATGGIQLIRYGPVDAWPPEPVRFMKRTAREAARERH